MKIGKRSILMVVSLLLALSFSVFGTVAYLTSTAQATNTFTVGDVNISLDETDVDEDGNPKFPVDTDGDGIPDAEISVDPDGTITITDPTDPTKPPVVIVPDEDGNYPDTDIDGDGDNDKIEVDPDGNVVITDPSNPDTPIVIDPDADEPDRDTENEYNMVPGKEYLKDPTVTVLADSETSYVRMQVVINNYADLTALAAKYGYTDVLAMLVPDVNATVWLAQPTETDTAADTITYEFWYHEPVNPGSADKVLEPLFTTFAVPGLYTTEDLQLIADLQIDVHGHAIQQVAFDSAEAAWAAFDVQHGL